VEETGAFVATMFIVKSGMHACQFWPKLPGYTAHMAHVSH